MHLMSSMSQWDLQQLRTCGHVLGGPLQLHPLQLALPLQPLAPPLGSRSLLPQQHRLQLEALGLSRGW